MFNSALFAAVPYDVTQMEGIDFAVSGVAVIFAGAVIALICTDRPYTDHQDQRTQARSLPDLPMPVPAMGRWRIDVRGASFRLVAGEHDGASWLRLLGDTERSTAWSNRPVEEFGPCEYPTDVGFAIPIGEVDQVLASIEQVHASSTHKAWWTDPTTGPESTLPSYFRTELVDGWVHVYGPMIIESSGAPWREGRAVEIEYRYLPWLPGTLVAARANATPVCPGCEFGLPCQSCQGSGDRCDSIALREQDPRCPSCKGTGLCSRCEIEGVTAARAWADTVRDSIRRQA